MSAGEELGRGRTATVRAGAACTVVKEYVPGHAPEAVRLEARATEVATRAGLPVAQLIEARLESEPPSLVLRRVGGGTLLERMAQTVPLDVGVVLAEVQHLIRAVADPALVPGEDLLGWQIDAADMPAALRDAALRDVRRLTAHGSRVLCHMDLHPLNILWDEGPVVIDWNNGMAAPPEADVARTRLLLGTARYYVPGEVARLAAEALDAYLRRTEELRPGLVGASRAWDRAIAAARLSEGVPEGERQELLGRFAPAR